MAADDVYLAMVALDDPETLAQAVTGDWSSLDGLSLTADERVLVGGLIEEEAEGDVEGFSGGARFAAVRYTAGNVSAGVLNVYPVQSYNFHSWFQTHGAACAGGNCCKGNCQGTPRLGR